MCGLEDELWFPPGCLLGLHDALGNAPPWKGSQGMGHAFDDDKYRKKVKLECRATIWIQTFVTHTNDKWLNISEMLGYLATGFIAVEQLMTSSKISGILSREKASSLAGCFPINKNLSKEPNA